jgi:hypothetical protein
LEGQIEPGDEPLDQAAEGYRVMDDPRAVKTLLIP